VGPGIEEFEHKRSEKRQASRGSRFLKKRSIKLVFERESSPFSGYSWLSWIW
jgi:hypothetical protein